MFAFVSLQGKPFVSIEPEADINDVCVVPNSGLILMANEAPKMSIYFTPVSSELFLVPEGVLVAGQHFCLLSSRRDLDQFVKVKCYPLKVWTLGTSFWFCTVG